MNKLRRFWVSWNEPSLDPRPARNWESAPEWWCTGYGDGYSTICAVVDAEDENDAKGHVRRFWDPESWRFCEPKPAAWMPDAGRFPVEVPRG
jgi:hypothetical protein